MFQRRSYLGFLQLRIAERRPDIAMAEDALDDFDTLALRYQLAATRVPQLMGRVAGIAKSIDEPSSSAELGPLVVQGVI